MNVLIQVAIDGELDPEYDPNNQGEDEFEEAGEEQPQHRATEEEDEVVEEDEEPEAPAHHKDTHLGHEPAAVEDELVVSEQHRGCVQHQNNHLWRCDEEEKKNHLRVWVEKKIVLLVYLDGRKPRSTGRHTG